MRCAVAIAVACMAGLAVPASSSAARAADSASARGDGRIAFGSYESGYSVYTATPSGSDLRRVVEDGTDPVFSPDGRWLAFVRGYAAIWRVRADGSGARVIVPSGTGAVYYPSWSADGKWLSFTRTIGFINDEGDEDGRSYIYVVRRDGRRMRRLHRSFLEPSAWSPAGRLIVFGHRRGLPAIRPDGTHFRILRRGLAPSRLRFSPSGRRLAMADYSDRGPRIRVLNLRTGRLRSVAQLTGCCAADTITWAPDGRRLAYLSGDLVSEGGITRTVSTGLYTIRPDGTDRRRLATLPASAGLGGLSWTP